MNLRFTLRHIIKAKYRKGFGVHSPNIFDFFTNAIYYKRKMDYSLAEDSLKLFKKSKAKIMVTQAGAKGSGEKKERKISDIARKSSSYGKYGRLLQRISNYLKSETILELGTSLGIGTLYLAGGNPNAKITTVEACPATAKTAQDNFDRLDLLNIVSINSLFDNVIEDILTNNPPFGLVYVDGNHTYEATIRYYKLISEHASNDTVVIFDDINWSSGMARAWDEIKKNPKSRVSIETMRMGIVFFNNKLTQKIYCTRF